MISTACSATLPEAQKSRYSVEQLEADERGAHFQIGRGCCGCLQLKHSLTLCAKHDQARALGLRGKFRVRAYQGQIAHFIEASDVSVFAVNNPQPPLPADGVFFGNRRRVLQYFDQIPKDSEVVFGPEIHAGAEVNFALKKVSRVNALKIMPGGESPYPMVLPSNSAIEAILGLVQLGYQEIFICGLDGYSSNGPSHYYAEQDAVSVPEEIAKQNAQIAHELKGTQQLAAQLGFTFSIITPTLFSDFTAESPLS